MATVAAVCSPGLCVCSGLWRKTRGRLSRDKPLNPFWTHRDTHKRYTQKDRTLTCSRRPVIEAMGFICSGSEVSCFIRTRDLRSGADLLLITANTSINEVQSRLPTITPCMVNMCKGIVTHVVWPGCFTHLQFSTLPNNLLKEAFTYRKLMVQDVKKKKKNVHQSL